MRLLQTKAFGFAAAIGAVFTVSGSGAHANEAWYSSSNTVPILQAVINNTVQNLYKVTLSTTMGSADYMGFGFNWNGPALNESDFSVLSAFSPPGSTLPNGDPNTAGQIDLSELTFGLCGDGVTKISSCSYKSKPQGAYDYEVDANGPNNFNGGGSASDFDYIFAIGRQGAGENNWVDEVTFQIASSANWNPFSQLAARAQSTTSDPDPEQPGSGSVKADLLLCTTPNCITFQNPPVPEISATGSVAALGSVLALIAFLMERRGGGSMRRRSLA